MHVVNGIKKITKSYDKIEHVNEVLTVHMGPEFILVNISVEFRDEATATEIEDTVSQLDTEIKNAYENVKRIFIEGEARKKS
jgi:divalent metal cation (Fe/Co/Zn/Cd) transporter